MVTSNQDEGRVIAGYLRDGLLCQDELTDTYLVRPPNDDRDSARVALTVLKPQLGRDRDLVAFFLDQAATTLRLRHVNLVATREVIARSDASGFVTDWLPGRTLSQAIEAGGAESLPLKLFLHVLREVLRGLQYVHELSGRPGESSQPFGSQPFGGRSLLGPSLHGNLTPQCIELSAGGRVRIRGAGFARVHQMLGRKQGRPAVDQGYAAPELFRGSPPTVACDIYSVGVVLWEGLTGSRRIFERTSLEVARRRLAGGEPDVAELCRGVSGRLAAICRRALAVDPEQRFASAAEMREDIDGYLDDVFAVPAPGALQGELAAWKPSEFGGATSVHHSTSKTQLGIGAAQARSPAAAAGAPASAQAERPAAGVSRWAALSGRVPAFGVVSDSGSRRTGTTTHTLTPLAVARHSIRVAGATRNALVEYLPAFMARAISRVDSSTAAVLAALAVALVVCGLVVRSLAEAAAGSDVAVAEPAATGTTVSATGALRPSAPGSRAGDSAEDGLGAVDRDGVHWVERPPGSGYFEPSPKRSARGGSESAQGQSRVGAAGAASASDAGVREEHGTWREEPLREGREPAWPGTERAAPGEPRRPSQRAARRADELFESARMDPSENVHAASGDTSIPTFRLEELDTAEEPGPEKSAGKRGQSGVQGLRRARAEPRRALPIDEDNPYIRGEFEEGEGDPLEFRAPELEP